MAVEPAEPMIRPATPGDAPELARLRYELRAGMDAPAESMADFARRCVAWMEAHLRDGTGWRCWIAEASGRAIGAVWLTFIEKIPNPVAEAEAYGYITSFYVQPEHRGRGVGSRLLGAALDECDRRGVHSTVLWPTPSSRSLYERHGFRAPRTIMERPGSHGSRTD